MKALAVVALCVALGGSAGAHPGVGLVEDSKGNIYYTDLVQVWKMARDGSKAIVVPNVHTHELFIDDNDNLFGEHLWYKGEKTDTWGHYVWKLGADGTIRKVVPDTEGFRTDYSFVRDHFGRTYRADRSKPCQHVIRSGADRSKAVLGDECLNDIRWMTATAQGDVYLVDQHDLKKVDTRGKVTLLARSVPDWKAGQPGTRQDPYLSGVSVDQEGNAYVCDFSGRRVVRIDRAGVRSVVHESSSPWSPTAYLVTRDGRRVVMESSDTNEVRVLVNGK